MTDGTGSAGAPFDGDVTVILKRWNDNPQSTLEALTPVVYAELRKIASGYLRHQRADHALQPTELIHEAYLRLVKQESASSVISLTSHPVARTMPYRHL